LADRSIVEVARRSLADAVDLLWGPAMELEHDDASAAAALADLAARAAL
jgi:hypothetical protein